MNDDSFFRRLLDPMTHERRDGRRMKGGLPQDVSIVRAKKMPETPCATCAFFNYDRGQGFMDYHGIPAVPNPEGGFLKEGPSPVLDHDPEAGAMDSREYGVCMLPKRGGGQLTHRFATCHLHELPIRSRSGRWGGWWRRR